MKISYKFIHFEPYDTVWLCKNNRSGDKLGVVEWEKHWRQFVFVPTIDAEIMLSGDCLADIQDFMAQLKRTK